MLPDTARLYFQSLAAAANANASNDLERKLKFFEGVEFSRGQTPDSPGFKARLAALYADSLAARATAIVDALIVAHRSFESPVDESVDAQLRDWGARALSSAYSSLEGGYSRHLRAYGVDPVQATGLEHAYSLAQATVANAPTRHLWELRNVPSKRPNQGSTSSMQVTIHNSGTIGAVQTGADATANIQQQWIEGDTAKLADALVALRGAIERAPELEENVRTDLVADIDCATSELGQSKPSKQKLLRWLGGVGAVIGALGSIEPAYETVKTLAKALGLSL